jgi:hypothetical protein
LGVREKFPLASRALLAGPCFLIAMAGLGILVFVAWMMPQLAAMGSATATPIKGRDTFMDAITGISPALWGRLIVLGGIFGLAALAGGGVAAFLAWRRRTFPALLVLAAAGGVPIVLAAIGFTIMSPYFSLAEDARVINREIAGQPAAVVACEALPNTASSLLYYLNARVHWVNAPFDNQYAQQVLGEGRDYYWDDAGLQAAWSSGAPVYLIVEETRLPFWQQQLSPRPRLVKESGTRAVLANRPAP